MLQVSLHIMTTTPAESMQDRFQTLLETHRGIVFKVAGMYGRQAEDRHDIEQEICLQLWKSFPRYDERRAAFSTWMYRIALNVAISFADSVRVCVIAAAGQPSRRHCRPQSDEGPGRSR